MKLFIVVIEFEVNAGRRHGPGVMVRKRRAESIFAPDADTAADLASARTGGRVVSVLPSENS